MLTLIKKVIQSMGKPSRSFIARVGIAVLGMGLVACGDDNKLAGGDPNNSIIDGSGLAPVVGSIDGFGSIIIDGIRYNTDEAKIFAQGQVSAESNLAVGDYVTLFVRTDAEDRVLESGDVVDMVFYEAPVIGAITAIDLSDNALAIANQIIRLSSNTLFDSNLGARSLSDLALGDRVEVSGPSNNEGDIIATRIYAARQTQDVLSGLVFDQDETNQSFRLQGVVIDYSNAAVVNNFDNGDAVSVTGAFNPATQQIVATSVRLRDDRITPKELESVPFIIFGLVEGYELGDTFEVSGYSVKLAPETRFVGGNIDALQNNQLITVVGSLDSDGVVQAATIELDTSSDLDLFTDPDFENEDISDEIDEPLDTPSELDDSNESNDPPVEEDSIDQEIEGFNAEEEAINGDNIETEIVETEIVETEIV